MKNEPSEALREYHMTRVTFTVSSSLFAANMFVKQYATDYANDYPSAASTVHNSFYVDDGLCGADTPNEATKLHKQLQSLFAKGEFLLRRWRSSDLTVLRQIPPQLLDSQPSQAIPDPHGFTKTLSIEWSSTWTVFVSLFPTSHILGVWLNMP